MSTVARSPSEHYQEAERLILASAETPENAPALALAHALLTLAPRRARHAAVTVFPLACSRCKPTLT
jgi:hypothetical protein